MEISAVATWVTAALAISEGLALIPGMKSNSIFQLVYYILNAIVRGIKDKEV